MAKPRVLVVLERAIADDPRVDRQRETLEKLGYEVTVFEPSETGDANSAQRLSFFVETVWCAFLAFLPPRWWPSLLSFRREHRELSGRIAQVRPDIIHCHHPDYLPTIMHRRSKEKFFRLVFDAHEYFPDMRAESLAWRLTFGRFYRKLLRSFVSEVDCLISVSETVAQATGRSSGYNGPAFVIRNIPKRHQVEVGRTRSEGILLHYHGILNSSRGLTELLQALSEMPSTFRLRIVGPERQKGYRRRLQLMTEQLGLQDRVEILPEVAHGDLIGLAAEADIGIYIGTSRGTQNVGALPNKVFEYMMAGLMVVSGPSLEVKGLLKETEAGVWLPRPDAPAIVNAIASLEPTKIEACRARARAAAQRLCWEVEEAVLAEVYEVVGPAGLEPTPNQL